jgi:protocatechuate 3,4-dioxygenase beta subunit
MDNDDRPIGKIWTRRNFLALIGVTGGLAVAGGTAYSKLIEQKLSLAETSLPPCVARPEQTEGPYFVDQMLNRSDIRTDTKSGKVSQGTPFELEFRVSAVQKKSCQPLAKAMVDIWHCDAAGVYSDVSDRSFDTTGQNFLRGYQLTDSKGVAKFTTIFPGWYWGRAVHIHYKIRHQKNGANYEFTSQLYFDEKVCNEVYVQTPYAEKGNRFVKNERDGIFRGGGEQMILNLEKSGAGYKAIFEIGVETA